MPLWEKPHALAAQNRWNGLHARLQKKRGRASAAKRATWLKNKASEETAALRRNISEARGSASLEWDLKKLNEKNDAELAGWAQRIAHNAPRKAVAGIYWLEQRLELLLFKRHHQRFLVWDAAREKAQRMGKGAQDVQRVWEQKQKAVERLLARQQKAVDAEQKTLERVWKALKEAQRTSPHRRE